ncbi:hypothetical protein SEUCBS139899_009558 [Sporothrix eucalyptigena]|uniref:t-SNARE coiled-coil homology domain-containing protein n=1 Tax=Sporothrix eucalyptigena TaxID=1812306 RepID=A0ABP0BY89_9PEZI
MGRTDPLPPFSAPVASSFSSSTSSSSYDPYIDLGRLLARLEQNLLRADSDRWRRLVADEFQRLQARFDVAAARKLLTHVEQSALSIKTLTRRQDMQAELNRRRALIELLQERLDNLDEEARAAAELQKDNGGDDDDETDGENGADDNLAHIVRSHSRSTQLPAAVAAVSTNPPERSETSTNLDTDTTSSPSDQQPPKPRRKKTNRVRIAAPGEETSTATGQPTATVTASAATTTATPRPRKRRQGASNRVDQEDTARSTSAQVAGSPDRTTASLFEKSDSDNAISTEEAVLDHHRREQEALSEDILRLAQALKEKSLTTSRMLEDDKDVVDRVGEGMNTTTDSLSAASRSMAVLTRMTEGKGWWGRMMLLGMVYGMMLALLLIFLFLPKLRL